MPTHPSPPPTAPLPHGLLTVDEARRRIDALVTPVVPFERVALRDGLGRVLAEPVVATIQVPPHRNSAVDGYAVQRGDILSAGETLALRLVGRSQAGAPFAGRVEPGACVRILTGAVVPEGADCVIMQEDVEAEGDTVRVGGGHGAGDNVRMPGDDLRPGDVVAGAGARLTAAHLGAIASIGVAEITVRRRPRVAFFSTGDELRGAGEALGPGDIYDSNRYALAAMLRRLGADGFDLGVIRDRPEDVRRAFASAAAAADAIVTSGGVSVGDTDYVKEALGAIGEVDFWRIAMKPGKPLAVGRVARGDGGGAALFFGLPGNPVSTMVTFYQFVQPALRRLAGETDVEPLLVQAVCETRLVKQPGRLEYQRGVLRSGADGRLVVTTTGLQGSHVLSSMARANCFIVLSLESTGAAPGDVVTVQPFAGLV